jgi:beta-barrel assembly-enhancing protease
MSCAMATRKPLLLALSLMLAFGSLNGCGTTQSGVDLGNILGAAAGSVLPVPAGSLVKAGSALGKSFQDITPEQEYYLGRAVAASVLSSFPAYSNEEANRYLNVLGQTLAQASDRPDTFGGYHFLLLDSPEINAFAAPGGLILVTRGMIRLCKTEDALAAVLAHEIGHIQGQHGLKSIKTSRLTTAFNILAMETAKHYGPSQLGQLTEAFEGSITDITATLMNNGYSRELESDADKAAAIILKRVGYDPGALVTMLSEMQKQMKPGGTGFAKTHPQPNDRIKQIGSSVAAPSANTPPPRQKRFEDALGKV